MLSFKIKKKLNDFFNWSVGVILQSQPKYLYTNVKYNTLLKKNRQKHTATVSRQHTTCICNLFPQMTEIKALLMLDRYMLIERLERLGILTPQDKRHTYSYYAKQTQIADPLIPCVALNSISCRNFKRYWLPSRR